MTRAVFLAWVALLAFFALRADVLAPDAMDYIGNARALLGRPASLLVDFRPPLLSLALVPVAATELVGATPTVVLALARLVGVLAVAIATLATTAAATRATGDRRAGLIAGAFVACERILVHDGPLLEACVPGAALVALTLAAHARAVATDRARDWALVALAAAGACMARWEAGALLVALAVTGRRGLVAAFSGGALAGLSTLLLFLLVYDHVAPDHVTGLARVREAALVFRAPFGHVVGAPDVYLRALLATSGPVVLLLALRGAPTVRAHPTRVVALVTLALLLAFYSVGISNRMVRYAATLVPALALVASCGAHELLAKAKRPRKLALVLVAPSVALAAFEAARHVVLPVHASGYAERVALEVRGMLANAPPGAQVYWARGNRYRRAADPSDPAHGLALVQGDVSFYSYPFGTNELALRVRRPIPWIAGADGPGRPWSRARLLEHVRDGDVVIESDLLDGEAFPPQRHAEPLRVAAIERDELARGSSGWVATGRRAGALAIESGRLVAREPLGPRLVLAWTREGTCSLGVHVLERGVALPAGVQRVAAIGGSAVSVAEP